MPPPLTALHDVIEHSLTDILLFSSPVIYIAPPLPEDALHDVNVVLDPSIPVMDSVFPAPTDPQITAPFEYVEEAAEREIFSNEQDVMVTSVDASKRMRGEERVSVVDGVTLMDVRVSVPEDAEKRE